MKRNHLLRAGVCSLFVLLSAISFAQTIYSVDAVRSKELDSLRRVQNIEEIKSYYAAWSGRYQDSVLFILHDIYANSSSFKDLETFYANYNGKCLRTLKKEDQKALKIFPDFDSYPALNAEKMIKVAGQYHVGYLAFLQEVKYAVKNKSWTSADAIIRKYEKYMTGNPEFEAFKRVIYAEPDPSIVITSLNKVNTARGNEYVPVLSADGRYLYFCGQYRPDSVGREDVYVSSFDGKEWGAATTVKELCDPKSNDSPVSISTDGTRMILFVNGRLYTTDKGVDSWQKPVPLPDVINIAKWQSDAIITSDGKAMLFAATKQISSELRPSTNIFVSLLQENGEWGEPIDLGATINTPYMDRSPVLHPDMKTLYFCSEGHGSLGRLDVFMSQRLSDTSWVEWSEPVNLGKEINTIDYDCWYQITTDGKDAYFSRVSDGRGYDLYRTPMPASMRPTPVATIQGKVTDTKGNQVATVIRWEDLETHEQVGQSNTDPVDGSFFIVLPEGKNYGYYIDDDRYFPLSSNIDLREKDEPVTIENNIVVASIEQMVKQQIAMPMNNLFFNTGEAELLPASINELQRVIKILKKHPQRIEIGGHTDNVGSDAFNKNLSEQRAKAVRDYLVENGIPAKQLVIRGYGKSKPIADNNTEEGRQRNRRVEFKFIK